MNEFEDETKPEPGPSETGAPVSADAPAKRKRRRRGGRRHRRRPTPVQGTGLPAQAEGNVEPAAEPALPEMERAAAPQTQDVETDQADTNETTAPAESGQSEAAAPGQASRGRRRRRGGRRHRRHDRPASSVPGAGPAPAAPVAAPAPAVAAEPLDEVHSAPVLPAVQTNAPSSRTSAPALAPSEPLPAPLDLNGLVKKEGTDGLRQLRVPGLDVNRAKQQVLAYIREWRDSGAPAKIMVGMSGGVNSALTASLLAEALGGGSVHLVFLQDGAGDESARLETVRRLAVRLHVSLEVAELGAWLQKLPGSSTGPRPPAALGVLRHAVLADLAWRNQSALAVTQNRTARLLAASGAAVEIPAALSALGQLYSVQVKELARSLNLPGEVIGQREAWREGLPAGLSAEVLDGLLYQLLDAKVALAKLLELGAPEPDLRAIYRRLRDQAQNRAWSQGPDLAGVTAMRPWPTAEARRA